MQRRISRTADCIPRIPYGVENRLHPFGQGRHDLFKEGVYRALDPVHCGRNAAPRIADAAEDGLNPFRHLNIKLSAEELHNSFFDSGYRACDSIPRGLDLFKRAFQPFGRIIRDLASLEELADFLLGGLYSFADFIELFFYRGKLVSERLHPLFGLCEFIGCPFLKCRLCLARPLFDLFPVCGKNKCDPGEGLNGCEQQAEDYSKSTKRSDLLRASTRQEVGERTRKLRDRFNGKAADNIPYVTQELRYIADVAAECLAVLIDPVEETLHTIQHDVAEVVQVQRELVESVLHVLLRCKVDDGLKDASQRFEQRITQQIA